MIEIIEILEKRIASYKEELDEYEKLKKILEESKMFDDDKLNDLSYEEVLEFEKKVTDVIPLDYSIVNVLRNLKYSIGALSSSELKAIERLKNAINISMSKYSDEKLVSIELGIMNYTEVIDVLSNDKEVKNLNSLFNVLDEINIPVESKLEILGYVNEKVIKNYVPPVKEEEDEILDESSLEITNMSSDDLKLLFKKYGIDWFDVVDKTNNQTRKIIKGEKISEFIDKLQRYGKYEKYNEILSYLKEQKLDSVFNMPEILTKVLLYSSVDKIENLFISLREGGLSSEKCITLIKENPIFLYPAVREKSAGRPKKRSTTTKDFGKTKVTPEHSGSLNYVVSNLEFLKEIGISSEDVYENCVTLLSSSTDSLKKRYEVFKGLYGIDFNAKNLSALKYNLVEWLDIMIESNSINYAREYPTTVFERNPYAIKYLYSKGNKYGDLFTNTGRMKVKNNPLLHGSIYDSANIFEDYNAVEFDLEDRKKYDKVLERMDNYTSKFDCILTSEKIARLDKEFMLDDLTYNMDGVLISRVKVLRIYDALVNEFGESDDILKYAVTYNSLLNQDELTKIGKCLSEEFDYERKFGSFENIFKKY